MNVHNYTVRNAYIRFVKKYHLKIELAEFAEALTNIDKITPNARLRSFQYKLMHCAIFSNVTLKKWKVVDTELCMFKYGNVETITHMLIECPVVCKLWSHVGNTYCYNFQSKRDISPVDILLNRFHYESKHVLNFIGLIIKLFIYVCKC